MRRALGGAGTTAAVVALDARAKLFSAYEGRLEAGALVEWADALRVRQDSDMEPLASPLAMARERRARCGWVYGCVCVCVCVCV